MIELKVGVYDIPKDVTYKITGRVLTVKQKSDRWRKEGDFRCLECKHRVPGFCKKTNKYETFVCELKPKGDGLFYGAPEHGGKNCTLFDHRDE